MKITQSKTKFFHQLYTFFFFVFILIASAGAEEIYTGSKEKIQSLIGPVYGNTIDFQNHFYAVSSSGVLFKIQQDFTKMTVLHKGQSQSTGYLTLYEKSDKEHILIWGDGIHFHNKSQLYFYHIESNSLVKSIPLDGHIEKGVIIEENKIQNAAHLYVTHGDGGVSKIDLMNYGLLWNKKDYNKSPIHSDSKVIIFDQLACFGVIKNLKGILCVQKMTGDIVKFFPLKYQPFGELHYDQKTHELYGFSTDASMTETEFRKPSTLYLINLSKQSMTFEKEFRGYNIFGPMKIMDEFLVSLSTGEILSYSHTRQDLKMIHDFPEPFINNFVAKENRYCTLGIMGKLLCFERNKIINSDPKTNALKKSESFQYAKVKDERLLITTIGETQLTGNFLLIPTRQGIHKVDIQ